MQRSMQSPILCQQMLFFYFLMPCLKIPPSMGDRYRSHDVEYEDVSAPFHFKLGTLTKILYRATISVTLHGTTPVWKAET